MLGRILALALTLSAPAFARDNGQWADAPAANRQWFNSLMQPDNPIQSCCGEADAFEADEFEVNGDHYVAIITKGGDEMPIGTRIDVPNAKIKWDKGNPTGHGIIFLSGVVTQRPAQSYNYVDVDGKIRILYCYVPPSGT